MYLEQKRAHGHEPLCIHIQRLSVSLYSSGMGIVRVLVIAGRKQEAPHINADLPRQSFGEDKMPRPSPELSGASKQANAAVDFSQLVQDEAVQEYAA
jgi:hypothetical protein